LCGQSPPTVYRVLQRLCEAGWVECEWEAENPEPGKPRRRFYWLTEDGQAGARAVLEARSAAERSAGRARRGRASFAGGGL
jgi:PadR family transcriptional regulator PadR